MPNRTRPERFYQNQENMLLKTTGANLRNTINPDYTYHKDPHRQDYSNKTYQPVIHSNQRGTRIGGKNNKFTKKSADIRLPPSNLRGRDKGMNYQQRDIPFRFNNNRNVREGQQLKTRAGNITSSIKFPQIPGEMKTRKSTLQREKTILDKMNKGQLVNNLPEKPYINNPSHTPRTTKREEMTSNERLRSSNVNNLPEKPYINNPTHIPRSTKRELITNNERLRSSNVNNLPEKPYINNPTHKPRRTRREDVVLNKHSGHLTRNVKNNILYNLDGIQLKPTYRYQASIVAGKRKGNLVSLHSLAPVFDREDVSQARETRRQNTLYEDRGNVTGNYLKPALHKINPVKVTRKQNVTSFTPNAAGDYGSDPRYYHPETLTHDVKKYAKGYTFTDTRAKVFGERGMLNHKLKPGMSSTQHRELENRSRQNPDGMRKYTQQYGARSQYTHKSNKLPVENFRCISVN